MNPKTTRFIFYVCILSLWGCQSAPQRIYTAEIDTSDQNSETNRAANQGAITQEASTYLTWLDHWRQPDVGVGCIEGHAVGEKQEKILRLRAEADLSARLSAAVDGSEHYEAGTSGESFKQNIYRSSATFLGPPTQLEEKYFSLPEGNRRCVALQFAKVKTP